MAWFDGSTEKFEFYQWSVEVHRKAFRRSITIRLLPGEPIKVSASKMTTQKMILDFLLQKKQWIEKCYSKFDNLQLTVAPTTMKQNEKFYFQGQELFFSPTITLGKKYFFSMSQTQLLLHVPQSEWSAESLKKDYSFLRQNLRQFFHREAVRLLTARMKILSEQASLKPTALKFREPRTRWGSCSSQGVINLNWKLVVYPMTVIDYVIIHELCHLRHLNHSEKFWDLVESLDPKYKESEKFLKLNPRLSHFLAK